MYNDEQTARVICLRKDKTAKRIYSKILKKLGYQFQNLAHFFQTEKRYKYILGFFRIKPPRFWKQGFENLGGSPSRICY